MTDHRPRVLVTYGSRNGGTAGIAGVIAGALADSGIVAAVRPVTWVSGLTDYDAVVLGGAIYAGRWHRDARRFAHRHAADLRLRPVWVFSSGPLDASADSTDIPPVPQAEAVIREIGARGHVTFGGRLDEYAEGIVARLMLRAGHGGDFRNVERIRAWAAEIAADLSSSAAAGAR